MTIKEFNIETFKNMDSMHDSYASEIKLDNTTLTIIYDKLDEGVLSQDGQPYYKNKKLTIKYNFDSFCDAKIYYSKNKYFLIDMIENYSKFDKIVRNCLLQSFKFSVDSFNELMLDFSIRKRIKGKYHKYKYWGLEIYMDAIKITYCWE